MERPLVQITIVITISSSIAVLIGWIYKCGYIQLAAQTKRKRHGVLYFSMYFFGAKIIDLLSDIFAASEMIRKAPIIGAFALMFFVLQKIKQK